MNPTLNCLLRSRSNPDAYDDRFVLHGDGVYVVCHLSRHVYDIHDLPDAFLTVNVAVGDVPDQTVYELTQPGPQFRPTAVPGALFSALHLTWFDADGVTPDGCRRVATAETAEALAVRDVYEASGYDKDAVRVALLPWYEAAVAAEGARR